MPGPITFSLGQLISTVASAPAQAVVNSLGSLTAFFAATPQNYFTVPIPNNTLALYTLELSLDTVSNPVFPSGIGPSVGTNIVDSYTFPLSPASINKRYVHMSVNYDVRGDQNNNGVQRIVDNYGVAPPLITIAGTTGFQYHSLDGFKWTGKDSIAKLLGMITTYTQMVAEAADSPDSVHMPTLTFRDSYVGDSYNVIPFKEMSIMMDSSRTLYQNYSIQLLVTKILSAPAPQVFDPVTQAIVQVRGLLREAMVDTATNIVNALGESLGLPGA